MNINLKYHDPLRPYGKCVAFRGKGPKRRPEEQSAESGATKANYAINRCFRTVRIARQTRPVENKHFPYSLDLFVNFLDQAKKFDIIQPLLCLNFRHFSRARGSFVWESIFGPFVTTKGQEKPTITYLTHPEKTSMLFKPKSKI